MNLAWKRVLFALCILGGISLTSCSQDDEPNIGPGTDPTEEDGAFFSFRMLSGLDIMLPTRAVEGGEDAENVVSEALWVLYDDADKVAYSEIIDAETNGTLGTPFTGTDVASSTDRASFIMKAKQVKSQDYRLLVVLNPTAEMKAATTVGKYLSAFDDAKTSSVAQVSSELPNCIMTNIVMTNANGLVDVKKDVHMYETAAEAEAGNKPLVQVDRILAKVTFQMKPKADMDYPNGGELVNAIWKLDITNKKTYWMRRKAYHAPGMSGLPNNTNWIMEDGTVTDRSYYYAEDPNFDHFSIFRTGGTNNLPLLSEFDFETSGFITDLSTTQALTTLPTRQYALENTMNAQEQWEDVTTRALIRGNYVPEAYKDVAQTIPFAAGDSYYFFGGTAVSFDQIKTWYEDMVDTDNANYPWPTAPSGLRDAVVSAINANFIDLNEAQGRTESGSHNKLHFYKEGLSYYSTLIRHFDDTLSSNEGLAQGVFNFGRYGVVRNNVYKMTLTKITGPGTPTIPEPEGPDDKEKEYLSTEIEVLPWVIRTQNVEL